MTVPPSGVKASSSAAVQAPKTVMSPAEIASVLEADDSYSPLTSNKPPEIVNKPS